MKKIILSSLIILHFLNASSQKLLESGGGEEKLEINECISEQLREEIKKENLANIQRLGLDKNTNRSIVLFDWPLSQSAGFNDNSYYLISNFVDHNNASGQIQDYNCGNITYDGHRGTDIALWPFSWHMQSVRQVNIIAAQSGTIINKSDGQFDMNCTCTGTWNAVYIQHSDGSVAWYGHMVKGSLTTKSVGQTVVKGEYLGKVGSSGCSTGPHLHLEVYSNPAQTTLIDPFAGNCNGLNGNTSWWSS